MAVLCVATGILIIICVVRLIAYRREIKRINGQLDFLLRNDTAINVTSDFSTKELQGLIKRINEVVNKHRKLQLEAWKRENDIKQDFQNLSHDIRTPLTAISGYFQLLCDSEDKQERERYMHILERRISSIESMLEDIFTYSKLQDENYSMDKHEMNLSELVINTTLSFYDDMKQRHFTPKVEFTEEQLKVNGNEDAYARILQNIIKNALEHGKEYIGLTMKKENNRMIFVCENDYDEEENIEIDKVFLRFYKADQNRSHNSSGLGLSIAKMLADRMGAELGAKINENGRFEIRLGVVCR